MFVYTEELASRMTLVHSNSIGISTLPTADSCAEFVERYLCVVIDKGNTKEYYKFNGDKWVVTLSCVGELAEISYITDVLKFLPYVFDLTGYSARRIVEIARKISSTRHTPSELTKHEVRYEASFVYEPSTPHQVIEGLEIRCKQELAKQYLAKVQTGTFKFSRNTEFDSILSLYTVVVELSLSSLEEPTDVE